MNDRFAVCYLTKIGILPIKYFDRLEAALDFEKILEASAILNGKRRKDKFIVVEFVGSEVIPQG